MSKVHSGVVGMTFTFNLMIVTVVMFMHVLFLGFHLDNEVTSVSVNIGRIEHTAASLKSATRLLPTRLVEVVKIISPGEVERIRVLVVVINFNIVEEKVPRHISGLEIFTPCVESRSPEVHLKVLRLVHQIDCFVVT